MKNLLIFILPLACLFFSFSVQNNPAESLISEWNISKKSRILIFGSSNINRFTCSSGSDFNASTLIATKSDNSPKVNMKGEIQIQIEYFDCGNRMITSDMRKTLKSREYPVLTIRFISIDRMPDEKLSCDSMNGLIEINLAGTKKIFSIPLDFNRSGSSYELAGSRVFCFEDFNLTPPEKVGGLIKVNDSFEVNFSLDLITK